MLYAFYLGFLLLGFEYRVSPKASSFRFLSRLRVQGFSAGLGFGVWGSGFRFWGLGIEVSGLKIGVWSFGFRVSRLGSLSPVLV